MRAGPHSGARLLPEGLWDEAQTTLNTAGPVWVAVEDNYGHGAAVAAVVRLDGDDDLFELDAWTCDTWETALDDALALLDARPSGSRLVLGAAVAARVPRLRPVHKAGATETRLGLSLLRDLVRSRRVFHDRTPDLDVQVEGARTRDVPGGGLALISSRRSDALRAAVWALHAAQTRTSRPAIH